MTLTNDPVSEHPPARERLINLPPLTLALLIVLFGIHLMRLFVLTPMQDEELVLLLGFVPARLRILGTHDILPWLNLVTYALLHFGWTHMLVNGVGLAAFGAAAERLIGRLNYSVVLLVGTITGALLHFVFFSTDTVLLGGISAGLSGVFAVVLGVIQQTRQRPWRSLAKPVLAWIVINVVMGLIGVPGQPGLAIAWVAHLGGFVGGLVCLPFFVPAYRFSSQGIAHE